MVKQPLVSIILTTFNRAHLIEEMLDSIIKQAYVNWECFIIDDNSTDKTKEIVNKLIKNDVRFTFIIKSKNLKSGLPASRNIGINNANGDYLVFFDDDDVIHEKLIETCIKEFLNDKSLSFIHYQKKPFIGDFDKANFSDLLNNKKEILSDNIYEKIILRKLQMASCTVMWRTGLLKENKFNESLMYSEEWECYSRIFILNNLKGLKLETILYFNRKHPNSNTGEFADNNLIRFNSHVKAHLLLSTLLIDKNKMTKKLRKFFFTSSHLLKSKNIVKPILKDNIFAKFLFYIFPLKYKLHFLLKNKIKNF